MIVRAAIENDLPEILEIYNDVILNTTAVYDYEPHTLAMRKQWFEAKLEQNFPVLVVDDGQSVVGFGSLGSFRNWPAYQYTVENSVYVSSHHRGKGIGKMLIAALLTAARQLQMHTVVAGIDATNQASIMLHKGFGFKQVAYFKQVGYKFNKWLDLVFMQLMLHQPIEKSIESDDLNGPLQ